MWYRLLVVAILSCFTSPVEACSWEGISPENSERTIPERLREADNVIHGRVISLRKEGSMLVATLQVIRSFKGGSGPVTAASSNGMCGYRFTMDEERIFFIYHGRVSIAGVEPAEAWLISALKKAAGQAAKPDTSLERTRGR